jgi:hypothetical protein
MGVSMNRKDASKADIRLDMRTSLAGRSLNPIRDGRTGLDRTSGPEATRQ